MKPKRKRSVKQAAVDTTDFNNIPALAQYIERVGAEQRNFRRFVVKEQRAEDAGHYHIVHLIKLDEAGTVTAEEAYAPTESEQAAITADFKRLGVKFPNSILASFSQAGELQRRLGVSDENWYTFLNAVGGDGVVMCQQRIDKPDGTKDYLPWSFWTQGGGWLCMEPDGPLPFWKPAKKTHLPQIMIHEGAKAARYCDWLTNNNSLEARDALAAHPWGEDLKYYEHWGWSGGAPNHRGMDWDEVKAVKADRYVLVCDHDKAGENAANPIAKQFKGLHLSVLMFDDKFENGFDLADPMPVQDQDKDPMKVKAKYEPVVEQDKDKDPMKVKVKYEPVLFHDMIHSAIWATEPIPRAKGEKGPAFQRSATRRLRRLHGSCIKRLRRR